MENEAFSPTNNIALPKQKTLAYHQVSTMGWLIVIIGVLFYCFAYLLRIYPSVMEHELRGYFNITASSFGLLTSFYYFAYAPMQLPVGVSVDRIGPRRSLLVACLTSTIGVFLFAYFDNFGISLIGRFMVGFGAAFAYVTALKLAATWLPKRYFATATGMVTGCGMVAAIFTDMLLTHVVQTDGFKQALYAPLSIGLVLLGLVFLFVRDKPKHQAHHVNSDDETHALSYKELARYLNKIIRSPQMWLIGMVGALLYLPASVFLDVWAIPYLKYVHHLSSHDAALGVSIMLAGWICSSFSICALSDIFGSRKKPLVIAAFFSIIIACSILYMPHLSHSAIFILLFCFGLCCGPHPLCFTLSKENNTHEISGTAVSFANFIIMMGGFIFQPIVGKALDLLWDGKMVQGIRLYTAHEYTLALSILPIGLMIAAFCTLFIKETYR
jgi:sugar phosphate permease